MATLPFMPFAVDSYLGATTHLTDAEHGRYMLIIMKLWAAPKQRIPDDNSWLARHFNRSVEDVKTQLRPILNEFCRCDGKWIKQKRVTREFAYAKAKADKQAKRAKSRWNKEKDACRGNAPIHTPIPIPIPTPIPKDSSSHKTILTETPSESVLSVSTDAKIAIAHYNDIAQRHGWVKVRRPTDQQRRQILLRLKDLHGIEGWRELLAKASQSSFLNGTGERSAGYEHWRPGLDFFLKPKNFDKLLNGGFDDREGANVRSLSTAFAGLAKAASGR